MARTIIFNGKIYEETGERTVIVKGQIFEETVAAAAATGRVMSSMANHGGLAGKGGIAGKGGGLAG